ncbi:hypothetical protein SARC_02404 [Sphaeroforma arctica JP610]|uniref:Uncharacterized protein n=1 Tax=Sphaeroforma arctica JP610 TaxID=667725 RepID=A0A0L0G8S4_9EUKA|nr:hypothetical protein SARC_02404 [Sphaeroforma arctica JP610]KNC85405.1 hypothetical protein SARC_02404 [Sphaeroforma arctica JP610]|eukprot:XP_014159307.1 hypothetical protein SARC_02404 [Sphaeroforma arctica JP610]
MVTERGVTDNHSPVIGSVVSSTPKPQPQGYDDKGIDDTDIFRRKVHKRRVKFLNSHTVHHTFCADEYDRSKPPQREEDIEPIMTVYRELMKYKITEMVVHQDALQYTNHHLSRRDEAAHNIMMGTIRAIISEFTE